MTLEFQRRHFSATAIEKLADFKVSVGGGTFKPAGLWYSCRTVGREDGWEDWCRSERFNLDGLTWVHPLTLDLGRMVVIRSVSALDMFHEHYKALQSFSRYFQEVDWTRVKHDYAGIEIAPYLWERGLDGCACWYYAWDCASGCVWDLSAVTSWGPPERFSADEQIKAGTSSGRPGDAGS